MVERGPVSVLTVTDRQQPDDQSHAGGKLSLLYQQS